MKLTNEETRIKIAETLGWTECCADPDGWLWGVDPAQAGNECGGWCTVPNYPESLDACAGFEAHAYRTEPSGWLARYEDELRERCSTLQYPHYNPICATPRQRCLAYLKTKGLLP